MKNAKELNHSLVTKDRKYMHLVRCQHHLPESQRGKRNSHHLTLSLENHVILIFYVLLTNRILKLTIKLIMSLCWLKIGGPLLIRLHLRG